MERTLSQEERIRRAEAIYQGRRAYREKSKTVAVNVNEVKDFGLFKKVIIQILICMLLYFIFYLINTTNYTFSEGSLSKINEILNYDVDFNNIYNQSIQYIQEKQNVIFPKQEIEKKTHDDNLQNENTSGEIKDNIGKQSKEENNTENLEQKNEETKELSSIDIIKQKYSLIVPVNGTITSEFGTREVMAAVNASTNHQGIDIGAPEGTEIKSSTDGMVIYSGYSNSYRKLYNNRKW